MGTELTNRVTETVFAMNSKQKVLFVAGVTVMLAIAAPVAVMALTAITSLAMVGIVGLGISAGVIAFPMITRKWKNIVLKMMISEAQKNPIETLWNQYLQKCETFEDSRKALVGIIGKFKSLEQNLSEFRKKHGVDSSSKGIYDKMLPLVEKAQKQSKLAEKALGSLKSTIEMKSDEWNITLQTGDIKKMLKNAGVSNPLDAILSDAAFKSVQDAVNTELAELEMLLSSDDMEPMRSLPASSGMFLSLDGSGESVVEQEIRRSE